VEDILLKMIFSMYPSYCKYHPSCPRFEVFSFNDHAHFEKLLKEKQKTEAKQINFDNFEYEYNKMAVGALPVSVRYLKEQCRPRL